MKTALIFASLFITSISSFGQTIGHIKDVQDSFYTPEIVSGKHLYLKMDYGSPLISNAEEIEKLKGGQIASIDLLYSDHPRNESFASLNNTRIANLKKLDPTLFKDENIKWKLVRQTNCSDQASAQKLFHGFVITYRPAPSKELAAEEISFIDSIFKKPKFFSLEGLSDSYIIDPITKEKKISSKKDSLHTRYGGLTLDKRLISDTTSIIFKTPDSVVNTVLSRNNWANMAIVADLTGSMYIYTTQILVWLQLNTTNERVKQFVFFNDGNMTPDHKKVIGKTGGIYDTQSSTFEDVENLAFKTMQNGYGGDIPENDIEAILKAIELCPTCSNIVLVADNWASIKDISLMNQIKKPVKIILCGTDYGINPQYLNLAKATGGSVHTMKEDLTELMNLNEGQELKIGKELFKIEKGQFVKISKT